MTRTEFINNVTEWYELKDFCYDNNCDLLDYVYDEDGRDNEINDFLRAYWDDEDDEDESETEDAPDPDAFAIDEDFDISALFDRCADKIGAARKEAEQSARAIDTIFKAMIIAA